MFYQLSLFQLLKMKVSNMDILKRRLDRLKNKLVELEKKHLGNELNYTYWGGYDMGYLKGKISEIENIIDELTPETTKN